jgi:hypothetical protein
LEAPVCLLNDVLAREESRYARTNAGVKASALELLAKSKKRRK